MRAARKKTMTKPKRYENQEVQTKEQRMINAKTMKQMTMKLSSKPRELMIK